MKILIADDEETNLILLQKSLEAKGHEILACRNGQEVLKLLDSGELPQLVLLDWVMPETDGLQVCKRIRERQDLPYTYVMMITGKGEREDILAGVRAGANDYLTKPLKPEELETRIHAALELIELNNLVNRQRLKMIANAKMATLGEMTGGLAHEINNPLAVIQGHVTRLLDKLTAGELSTFDEQKVSYEKILLMIGRISRIINAMRSFAFESDDEPVALVPLKSVIDDVLSFCGARFRHSRVEIRVDPLPGELRFEGQKAKVCQALLSLLDNALLAAKAGTEKWVRFEFWEDENSVYVALSDSGPGIPANLRNKVMQPFFTTRPPGKGNGLGLSVSKGLLESHQGNLALDTDVTCTRFVIRLPRSVAKAKKAA